MHRIPVIMATQHPDNASAVYFRDSAFMDTASEVEECYRSFAELGCDEYMWDWEGKFVDEAVVDKLLRNYSHFFQKQQLGKDVNLTFRVPNIWEESGHRLVKAFTSIIAASVFAKDHGFYEKPIFEIILPMTSSSEQLQYLFQTFQKSVQFYDSVFEMKSGVENIHVIPLVEKTEQIIDVSKLLREYLHAMQTDHYTPEYIRLFIARSDPAMNAGIIPSVLAVKAAISQCFDFEQETNIPVYTWLGGGALPFRGGINPENVDGILEEYAGLQSLTVQSAFRYDYTLEQAKQAIQKLKEELPKRRMQYEVVDSQRLEEIKHINDAGSAFFQETIEGIADTINDLASVIPNRRERVQHVGLFGYSRGVGGVKLPRAIKFTAALYSLGIPPELISTGRTLRYIQEQGYEETFQILYKRFREDILHAGHYLNRENLDFLIKKSPIWEGVEEDIALFESYLGESLGPVSKHHFIHRNLTSSIYLETEVGVDVESEILKAAQIRKSLG